MSFDISRLLQRSDTHTNAAAAAAAYPSSRMLMDASASFDATDAIGSVSEHSAQSDTPNLTREQIIKLSSTLNKLQIDTKDTKADRKPSLSEIGEVLTPTPVPSTPAKAKIHTPPKSIIDDNASTKSEVKSVATPKQRMVLTPPPKKQKNYNPSVKSIQSQMHVTIVHVEKHDTVYVVPTDDYQKWAEFVKEVNEYGKTAENLKRPPEVGFIILAKPKNGDSLSRAVIKKIRTQEEIAKIEFLEFGLSDIVKFSEMKCLSENLVNACRLVNQVRLSGVPDEMEHAAEIVRFLKNLQDSQLDLIVKNLEPIEKTATSAHFTGVLIDTEKFTVINDHVKELSEVDPQPIAEMEEITEPQEKSSFVCIIFYILFHLFHHF